MKTVLCTIATVNWLHYAINLARSVRSNWADAPPLWIAVVGAEGVVLPSFEMPADVHFVAVEDLSIPNLGWLSAKFTSGELCGTVKPFLVRYLLDHGADQVVFSDADIHFFAAPCSLMQLAAHHSLVVTPHVLAPFRPDEAWLRPSMGDLSYAGVLNSGLFVVSSAPDSRAFLEVWADLCTGPGAFCDDLGPQREQNAFNWMIGFAADVAVCRDPGLNVAYWNLHERTLRWAGLDGGGPDVWTLEDTPLVCFHFSGFEGASGRLSKFDGRYDLSLDINLHALCAFYARRLEEAGRAVFEAIGPQRVVRGASLGRAARELFKRSERFLVPAPVGGRPCDLEMVLDRLALVVGPHHFIPLALEPLTQQRPDLVWHAHYDRLFPKFLLQWATESLCREPDAAFLFEVSSPFAYERHGLASAARRIATELPDLEVDAAARLLRHDRLGVLEALERGGADTQLVTAIRQATFRFAAYDPALCVRLIYSSRPDLQQAFPDPLGSDSTAFRAWLCERLAVEYEIPSALAEWTVRLDPSRSLANILAFVRLEAELTRLVLDRGFDANLFTRLLPLVPLEPGFSSTDLIVAAWWAWTPERSASGVVAPRATARPTPLEVWHRETVEPGGMSPDSTDPSGLNVFGYFRSPIGLGSLTEGLCAALALAQYRTREVVLSTVMMGPSFELADLVPDTQLWFGRNLVVSYPHTRGAVFDTFPAALFRDRETIGYLAWEQRDVHPDWRHQLNRYERLLAISSFSAEALGRAVGRPVGVLPAVVEVDESAARAFGREHFGIPASAFVAGILFDASSSVERKNPLDAARALVRAFGHQADVRVVLKVSNGRRAAYRQPIEEVRRTLAQGGLDPIVFLDSMPLVEVHGLIATLDLYLSLHRSEGFGYTLAEAMWLSVPVVATRYSGNLDFMNDGNSWLVECHEVRVRQPEGPFRRGTVWAQPDVGHAAACCRVVYEQPAVAKRRAARASDDVRRTLSPAALAKRVRELIG